MSPKMLRHLSGRTKLEEQIFDVWEDLSPSTAFRAGLDDRAGRFFVPSEEAVSTMIRRMRELKASAENDVQRKFLTSLERGLLFDEPQTIVDGAFTAFFDHIAKEGVNAKHLISLSDRADKALDAFLKRVTKKKWSTGVKVLTILRCNGFLELLETIRKQTKDLDLQKRMVELQTTVKQYRRHFAVKGVKEASFEEVFPIFRRTKEDLGRRKFYATFLKEAFDYAESPEELEARGLRWLNTDLPKFKQLAKKLAKIYRVKPESKYIKEALKKKSPVKPDQLVKFTKELRTRFLPWINKRLLRVNPGYDTRIIETPPYLAGIYPTAGVLPYNYLKGRPFQIYFITTDPKRDPPTGLGDLMQLLVHEEYGHCVNYSNSAVCYVAKPSLTEMLDSLLMAPVTEGFAFYLEKEFVQLFNDLVNGKDKSEEGRALLKFLRKHVDPKKLALENDFIIRDWSITRYLRVIGDARINSGKQSLAEFVEWASKRTGLSESRVYHQIFPAHEGIAPGYATCYAVVGERIRELKNEAVRKGKDAVEFNTYANGIGFPARTIFEEKLKKFISN